MNNKYKADVLVDNHIGTSVERPLRNNTFVRKDDEKIKFISFH